MDPKLGLTFFDQLIKPISLYGSELWGVYNNGRAKPKDNWFEKKSLDAKFENYTCISANIF